MSFKVSLNKQFTKIFKTEKKILIKKKILMSPIIGLKIANICCLNKSLVYFFKGK